MSSSFLKIRKGYLPAILGVLCAGCSSNPYQTAKVTGRVLCNGQPAAGGVVTFEPIDAPDQTDRPGGAPGRLSSGTVNEDGSFSLKLMAGGGDPNVEGAVIGPHRVSFTLPVTKPVEVPPQDRSLPPEHLEIVKAELAKIPVYKPLPCGNAIAPGEVHVTAGNNEFEFTLKPGPAGRAPLQPRESD